MLPKITVITPSYNQAFYLAQTIRSVLGQEYPNLEYMIVDGGSTDGSQEIIERYAGQLAWWVSEPDEGQSHAINKGLARATGDIVAWLNSDDLYAPGAFEAVIAAFERHPDAGLIFGDAMTFDQSGKPLNDLVFGSYSLKDLAAFSIICQPAVFMRKAALAKAGMVNQDYHFLMDHELWIRIARQSEIIHIPTVLAFARNHPTAKNVAQAAGFGQEAYKILNWMAQQGDTSSLIQENKSIIYAGALRFNARYLLDGGLAWPALKAYLKSFLSYPPTALYEWHRMIFALLSLVGGKPLGKLYYRWRGNKMPLAARRLGIENVDALYASETINTAS